MAAPTLYAPASPTTGVSGLSLLLTPPSVGHTGFYVVRLDFPGGSTTADWTPTTSPDFQRPRDAYDMRWPTITNWEVPWFVLAVRGSLDLPTLEWIFPTAFNLGTVLFVETGPSAFLLRASDITNAAEDNLSPAAQPGAAYSIRGATGLGRTDLIPDVEQVVESGFPGNPEPDQAVLNGETATAFCAMVPTVITVGPPTVGDDTMTFAPNTWTPNFEAFFPDVWGSTLSIYPPGDAPTDTYGWHTGRIGWG